jgi:hypothetical protein
MEAPFLLMMRQSGLAIGAAKTFAGDCAVSASSKADDWKF